MCCWTLMRRSAIRRCAALLNNCTKEKDVTACTSTAAPTTTTSGFSNCRLRFCTTSSIRYFVEPGSTRPARRLISMRRSPQPRIPRRGQTSSRKARARLSLRIFFFPSLPVDSIVTKNDFSIFFDGLGRGGLPYKKESRIQNPEERRPF